MTNPKQDYTIKIWYARDTSQHPIFATVTNERYSDTEEFAGKTEKAVLRKIAEWMETK